MEHAGDDNVVILDIRDAPEAQEAEEGSDAVRPAPLRYIDGAVAAPFSEAGWRTTIDGVRGLLPPVEKVVGLIESLGIDEDDQVIVVSQGSDSADFSTATRIYWTFKYLGHDAVSILDGGMRAWEASNGETVAEPRTAEASSFEANVQPGLLAGIDDVAAAIESETVLVDARVSAQFEGRAKSSAVTRAGTIPTAINLSHTLLYHKETGRFASEEKLRILMDEAGLISTSDFIAFCNTAQLGSIAWFAFSEVLGETASLYDGSMAEWTRDPARQVVVAE